MASESHGLDAADAEKAKTESLYREVNERIYEVNAQRRYSTCPRISFASARDLSARSRSRSTRWSIGVYERTAPGF
jgi:hypothetical protein